MSSGSTVFICGAGISGLTLAYRLLSLGRKVVLFEMAQQAGGRCRSYEDRRLGLRVDNGNHLLLGANRQIFSLIRELELKDRYARYDRLHFVSVADHKRWEVGAHAGSPLIASIPGLSRWRRLRMLWQILRTSESIFPANLLTQPVLCKRLLIPTLESIFNTPLEEIAVQAVRDMMAPIRQAGRKPFASFVPKQDWGHALVEPLVERIQALGGEMQYGQAVRSLHIQRGKLKGFDTSQPYTLHEGDALVLALPTRGAAKLLPDHSFPTDHRAIINVHFKTELQLPKPIIGLTDGIVHWVFQKQGHISVTISAADHLLQQVESELIRQIWKEVGIAAEWRDEKAPEYRMLVEKNASFAVTPVQWANRPQQQTGIARLYLVGDYTATGLPGSIESAVASAERVADAIAG